MKRDDFALVEPYRPTHQGLALQGILVACCNEYMVLPARRAPRQCPLCRSDWFWTGSVKLEAFNQPSREVN